MNLAIPRKKPSEMLLYIWRIIDLPNISMKDLLYTISFELFLLSPEKTKVFIQNSIENELLHIDENNRLSLSPNLNKKLVNWQKIRQNTILNNMNINKNIITNLENLQKDKNSTFNTLLKAFLDKGTINRTVTISNKDFNIIELDLNNGNIKAEVTGSKNVPYLIEIDVNKKKLVHNCHDFQTKRAQNKKFCKHLVKLFLILKEKNKEKTINILDEIAEHINNWEFST